MNRARFLIVGASGFVGSHLYAALGREHSIATYNSRPMPGGVHFDATTMSLSDTILRDARGVTHAFLLHGMNNIDECARKPELAHKINVDGQKRIIDDLLAAGIVPVFASSDAVFDGTHGMWTEEDPVNPVLTYGRHKVQVEQYLQEKSRPWLLVRLAKVVGVTPGSENLLSVWMSQLEKGDAIRCAHDQVFSPVDVDDVVRALIRLVEDGATGIFHICGPRPVTRLEFLRLVEDEVRKYRSVSSKITSCSIRDFDFAEKRPLNTSMSPRKLYSALGGSFDELSGVCVRAAAARYADPESSRAGIRPSAVQR